MGCPNVLFRERSSFDQPCFLLNPKGIVGSTVEVSIFEMTGSTKVPKRYFTWEESTKSTKFRSPTSEKVVLFVFNTSGGLEVPSC